MDNDFLKSIQRMMVRFLPCLQMHCRDAEQDGALAYYGTGQSCTWAVQSNLNIAGGLAVLAASPELPAECPMSREEMRTLAARCFRYALRTHRTGGMQTTDEGSWGCQWISVLGLERMSFAEEYLLPYLTEEEREAYRRLREAEADFLTSAEYPVVASIDGFSGSNKPESNIWNGCFLLRAAKDGVAPSKKAAYYEKGLSFLMNGISVQADAKDTRMMEGRKISEWHIGPNFTDAYSLDHHGYLNVGYMVICLSNLAFFHRYLEAHGQEVPENLFLHARELWRLVREFVAPDGRLLRIGGDTRARYTYCQCYLLPALLFISRFLGDGYALTLAERYSRMLEQEQSLGENGGFFARRLHRMEEESYFYYCRLESDPFLVLGFELDFLLRHAAGTAAPENIPLPYQWHDDYHQACFLRNEKTFRSFVRAGNNGMTALCVPVNRSDLAEWHRNMTGRFGFYSPREEMTAKVREFPGGFLAHGQGKIFEWAPKGEGECRPALVGETYAAAALPDGKSLVCFEYAWALREMTIPQGWQGCHLNIPNDIFNGSVRRYCGRNFQETSDGSGRQTPIIMTGETRLNCDGVLSCFSLLGGEFLLLHPQEQNIPLNCGLTSLSADALCLTPEFSSRRLSKGQTLFRNAWMVSADSSVEDMLERREARCLEQGDFLELHVQGADRKGYLLTVCTGEKPSERDFGSLRSCEDGLPLGRRVMEPGECLLAYDTTCGGDKE